MSRTVAAKKQSGTQWTEDQITERFDTVKLRMALGFKKRLERLSEAANLPMSKLVERWIEDAEKRVRGR